MLPGNHDEFLREYLGTYFGEVEFVDRTVHTTALGRTYLVMHGDQFDVVVAHAKWLAHVGDWAYRMALRINIVINWVRRRLRRPYWSLSAWAKHKVKNAVSVIGRFEEALTLEARDTGVDGVICGHIHFADMHDRLGIHYINTGDWVESCTAVVRDARGAVRADPLGRADAGAGRGRSAAAAAARGGAARRPIRVIVEPEDLKKRPRRRGASLFGGRLLDRWLSGVSRAGRWRGPAWCRPCRDPR